MTDIRSKKFFEYPTKYNGLCVGDVKELGGKKYMLTKIEVYSTSDGKRSYNTYWRRDGLKNSRMRTFKER